MGFPEARVERELLAARLARRVFLAALAVGPVEMAMRSAWLGATHDQQLRVAEHWLRQITNGFVPGQPLPFVWIGLSVAAGGFAAVGALMRRRSVRSFVLHAVPVVALAVWFGAHKSLELLALLCVLVIVRLMRAGEVRVVGRRAAWCFAAACGLLWIQGSMDDFGRARLRANLRACCANQKTLTGAVEMYNLDTNTKLQVLDPEMIAKSGYL